MSPGESIFDTYLSEIIILGIVVFALIFIIICGYCKYVRKGGKEKMENQGRERSSNMREAPEDITQPSSESLSEAPQLSVPVKMRKRSMTFSETDEECRKYREDLADSYSKPETFENTERSRKKSVVTFVGVEEIDANES